MLVHRAPDSSMIGTSAAMSQAHDRVDRDVDRAFRDEHVLSEVADAAEAPAPVREREQLLADAVGIEALLGVPRE